MLSNVNAGLFLIGLLVVGIVGLQNDCPHPEETYPCYCEDEDERSVMYCNNLEENKQIVQALSNLTGYQLSTVAIWLFDTDTIKSDAFKGPLIKEITFTSSQVFLESPPFLGQENALARLTFIASFDEEDILGSLSLGHLEKLKDISFERNTIEVLKNDWLVSSGSSLRSITFDECKIEKLEDNVFSKISTLTTLFVMNNKITSITREMLPKEAEDLRSINLSGNKLATLPEDIFKNMPSLRSIDLERNQLTTLDEITWSPKIKELTRIYLEGNPFKCDRSLKWISKISLPRSFTGRCSHPSSLKGKEIRIMTPADFHQ